MTKPDMFTDLKKNIKEMSEEEIKQLIADVRDARKKPLKPPKASLNKKEKSVGSIREVNLDSLAASMNPDQAAKLLARLEAIQEQTGE